MARVVLKCRQQEALKRQIRKLIQEGAQGRPAVDHPDFEYRFCDWALFGRTASTAWRTARSSMVQWAIYTAARIKREADRSASCLEFRELFKHRQFSVTQRFKAVVNWRWQVFRCKAVVRRGYTGAYPGAVHCGGYKYALAAGRCCACRKCCDKGFEHPQSWVREKFEGALDKLGSRVLRAVVEAAARRRVQALQGIRIWRQQQAAYSKTTQGIRTLFKGRKQAVYKAQAALRRWQRAMLLMTCKIWWTDDLLDEREERWFQYLLIPTNSSFIMHRGGNAMNKLGFRNPVQRDRDQVQSAIVQFEKNYIERGHERQWVNPHTSWPPTENVVRQPKD
jgi:hypothetical protein